MSEVINQLAVKFSIIFYTLLALLLVLGHKDYLLCRNKVQHNNTFMFKIPYF